jgi:putative DNA primase/helicase
MSKTKLEHALNYAAQGVPVLPLHYIRADGRCSCDAVAGKCKPGKHPFGALVSSGVKSATTDAETVKGWFEDKPYNIGIATGNVSGFFAVDRDDRDGGNATIEEWVQAHGELPTTLTQRPSDGIHLLFKLPQGMTIKSDQKKTGAGIDIRGDGGYICAAPSIHESGHQYHWKGVELFDRSLIADAPTWLIDKLQQPQKKQARVNIGDCGGFKLPDKVADGEGRESTLISYAGHLRIKGVDQATIDQILLDFNRSHITPPLDDDIVLDRARRYESDAIAVSLSVDGAGWELPLPLKEILPDVPPFNLSLLPKMIADYALDVAERMSCPVEFPAIAALIAIATAIGSQVHSKPYAKGSWLVPAGGWGLIVSPPSQIKSPPLSEMLRPLKFLDTAAADQFKLDEEQYKIDKGIYDKAIKAAISKGNRTPGAVLPPEPKMTRYVVNDSTYEMLVKIADANPNGFLVYRDELSGWFHSLNKENQKEARGLFLTGWSGTEGYATDRIGRGHVRAERLNISLIGTIQPNVLRNIVYDAVSGGVGDDGLVQRFQFAVYPDPTRKFIKVDRHPNFTAMLQYEDLIKNLANLDPVSIGASITPDKNAYLFFDEVAQTIFDDWREILEARLRDPDSDETPAMLAHLGKYRSLFPKIALILHLADGQVGAIGKRAAVKAKAWTMLLEAHARRIYHTATNRTLQSAVTLANKIKSGRLKNGFTRSDILIKEWANLRRAEEVSTALTVLVDMKWLKVVDDNNTGGRPTQRYYINPMAMTEKKVAA